MVLEKAEEPEIKLPTSAGSSKKQENSRKTSAAAAKSLQSCPTLCDPTDGSPPGSPIPGILQARTLEWVAISYSRVNHLYTYTLIQAGKVVWYSHLFKNFPQFVVKWQPTPVLLPGESQGQRTEARGQEDLPDACGQGRQPGGATPGLRSSSCGAQEGLEELTHVAGGFGSLHTPGP